MPPGMAAPSPGVMFGHTMQPMRPPPYQQPQPLQAASYQLQNGSGDAQNAQTSHSIVLTPMPTPITELTAAQRVAIESLNRYRALPPVGLTALQRLIHGSGLTSQLGIFRH
ncbi:hypothetical protein B0H14DRAFT_2556983 [Mycena olivaceomarginata]|nr:hypothetical protein B0H14DRAFT_2556983 [Mycena olivaceomarginata]